MKRKSKNARLFHDPPNDLILRHIGRLPSTQSPQYNRALAPPMCLIVIKGATMKITEQWLTERNACEPGIDWFTSQSANDPGMILNKLTSEERYDWAIWLVIELMTNEQRIQFAIYCAREVLPIYEEYCSGGNAPRLAIESAEAYLRNPCEKTADAAADAAARAADAAADAAARAADAAAYYAAAYAADAAAYAAARAADYAADAKQFQMKIITYARETLKL
jgi:hypothetical protein